MHPLDWSHRPRDISDVVEPHQRTATEDERAKVAEFLEVPKCDALEITYALAAIGKGRVQVRGRIKAGFEQLCVVSLEPVRTTVSEAFEVEFWPPGQLVDQTEVFVDEPDEDDPEPIEDGRIMIGRLAAEILASSLDLYPRRPDEALEIVEAGTEQDENKVKPFAGLAALKDKT